MLYTYLHASKNVILKLLTVPSDFKGRRSHWRQLHVEEELSIGWSMRLWLDDLTGDLGKDPRPSQPHLHVTWLSTERD